MVCGTFIASSQFAPVLEWSPITQFGNSTRWFDHPWHARPSIFVLVKMHRTSPLQLKKVHRVIIQIGFPAMVALGGTRKPRQNPGNNYVQYRLQKKSCLDEQNYVR